MWLHCAAVIDYQSFSGLPPFHRHCYICTAFESNSQNFLRISFTISILNLFLDQYPFNIVCVRWSYLAPKIKICIFLKEEKRELSILCSLNVINNNRFRVWILYFLFKRISCVGYLFKYSKIVFFSAYFLLVPYHVFLYHIHRYCVCNGIFLLSPHISWLPLLYSYFCLSLSSVVNVIFFQVILSWWSGACQLKKINSRACFIYIQCA